MNHELLLFYLGEGTDNRGRTLATLLTLDDSKWEVIHDFVQWVFPLAEPSAFNQRAPQFDAETIAAFRTDSRIRTNVSLALARAERFLDAYETDPIPWWLDPYDHNLLRITRILKFLMLTGFEPEARRMHAWLEELATKYPRAVTYRTLAFWQEAVDPNHGGPSAG